MYELYIDYKLPPNKSKNHNILLIYNREKNLIHVQNHIFY